MLCDVYIAVGYSNACHEASGHFNLYN